MRGPPPANRDPDLSLILHQRGEYWVCARCQRTAYCSSRGRVSVALSQTLLPSRWIQAPRDRGARDSDYPGADKCGCRPRQSKEIDSDSSGHLANRFLHDNYILYAATLISDIVEEGKVLRPVTQHIMFGDSGLSPISPVTIAKLSVTIFTAVIC